MGWWKVEPDLNMSLQSVEEMMKSLPQESGQSYLSFLPAENWDGADDQVKFTQQHPKVFLYLFLKALLLADFFY